MNARRAARLAIASTFFVLAACAPAPTKRPPSIGDLVIDGHYAYVNAERVQGRRPIYDGDIVTTGPDTSVKILLRWGGYVQLDQNTDPLFQLVNEGLCILVKVATGKAYVDAQKVCIDDSKTLQGTTHSRVNLRTDAHGSELTIIEGHVDLTSPTRTTLGPNQQYVVDPSGAYQQSISPEEANATIEWTNNYFQRANISNANSQNDGLPEAAAAALLYEIFRQSRDSYPHGYGGYRGRDDGGKRGQGSGQGRTTPKDGDDTSSGHQRPQQGPNTRSPPTDANGRPYGQPNTRQPGQPQPRETRTQEDQTQGRTQPTPADTRSRSGHGRDTPPARTAPQDCSSDQHDRADATVRERCPPSRTRRDPNQSGNPVR